MVCVRVLRPDDYDRLVALWEASGLPYRAEGRDRRQSIEREIDGPCSVFLVAEIDGQMVGAVLGTHDGRKGWVNRLAVARGHQRRGIGSRLVEELTKRFEDCGIGIVACLVEDWNPASMRFFEALGFVAHPECVYYSKRKDPDV
jgi:ribosomal protein S18 acetylase RimI-like enzyme